MRQYISYIMLGLAGIPIIYIFAFALAIEEMSTGIVVVLGMLILAGVIALVLALGGYLILPDRKTRRLLALSILSLSGGVFMIGAYVFSITSAPEAFEEALFTGILSIIIGIVFLWLHRRHTATS